MSRPPSEEQLAQAFRRAVERAWETKEDLFAAVDHAVLRGQSSPVTDDPVLLAAIRRTARSNITAWLQSVDQNPFDPVPANDGLDAVAVAAEFKRRGLEDESIVAFRDGQAAAIEWWVQVGSEVISDPSELSAFLTHSARSIFAFIDATTGAIQDRLERRQSRIVDQAARRRDLVLELLKGGTLDVEAQRTLGYDLNRPHVAAIAWTEQLDTASDLLDDAVTAIKHAAAHHDLLEVEHGAATRWLWIAGPPTPPTAPVLTAVERLQTVQVALGLPAVGQDGFRTSHRAARAAQQLIAQSRSVRSGRWEDLELPALLVRDPVAARAFILRTLGEFADADARLHDTVRTYLQLGANATRTAQALITHRNTILGRLKRADALLPRPLSSDPVRIACALEALQWLPPAAIHTKRH